MLQIHLLCHFCQVATSMHQRYLYINLKSSKNPYNYISKHIMVGEASELIFKIFDLAHFIKRVQQHFDGFG